jgi:DNA-binding NarL/FixJ family response regulator
MIKLLLVEKNVVLSNTLRNLFNQDKDIDVVGVCRYGSEVVSFLQKKTIDIILIDPYQSNGCTITLQVKREFSKVIIIGYSTDGQYTKEKMLEYGASSYLSKYDTSLNELMTEIKKYFNG